MSRRGLSLELALLILARGTISNGVGGGGTSAKAGRWDWAMPADIPCTTAMPTAPVVATAPPTATPIEAPIPNASIARERQVVI